jgi:hypothetical protein
MRLRFFSVPAALMRWALDALPPQPWMGWWRGFPEEWRRDSQHYRPQIRAAVVRRSPNRLPVANTWSPF